RPRGLHAHAKAADCLAVPERCPTTKGCRNLQNRRGHANAVVVGGSIDLVFTSLSALSEVDPNLGGSGLNGIIDMLAESRRRVVVADVPEGLNHRLPEEQRDSCIVLQDPSHDGLTDTRRIWAPGQRADIRLFVGILLSSCSHHCAPCL